MPQRCVWPANCVRPCGKPACRGRTCAEHLRRMQDHAGTLRCAWPGCARKAWEREGTCSFHKRVALGLIEER